jgi:uncharacterized protein YdeI (YjbR/CyaY-like superfamily)
MGESDPRVDAYIDEAAPFARPILRHLRALVHRACPDVEEAIKWGMPFFVHHGLLAFMAAFKAHAAFGLKRGAEIVPGDKEAMGQFGRLTALADLPDDQTILGYVRVAARLNEVASRSAAPARRARPEPPVPDDLAAALAKNKRARATFEALSPSQRRDYVEWLTEAKTAPTRARRLATALEWLAEGKSRNWKYEQRRAAKAAPKPRLATTARPGKKSTKKAAKK